jgi:hypothetical protein
MKPEQLNILWFVVLCSVLRAYEFLEDCIACLHAPITIHTLPLGNPQILSKYFFPLSSS